MFNAGVNNWQQCGAMEYFGRTRTCRADGRQAARRAGAKNVLCVLQAQGRSAGSQVRGVKEGLGSEAR